MALAAVDPESMGYKEPAVNAVFVINTNHEEHEDMHDGNKYVFPPNVPVYMPVIAAIHCFAYGQGDFENNLDPKKKAVARVGRDRNSINQDTMAEGLRWLKKFEFQKGVFVPETQLKKANGKEDEKGGKKLDPDLSSLK